MKITLRAIFAVLILLLLQSFERAEAGIKKDDIAITAIPLQLILGADAVVREDVRLFEYQRPGRARMEVRKVITILNSSGRDHGDISLFYNQFSDVSRISGAIYDSSGEQIRRFRNRDAEDRQAFDGISIIQDSRVKTLEMFHSSYPYTIELEYRVDYTGFINLPAFMPQSQNTSVQYSRYEISMPADQNLDYKAINFEQNDPEITRDGNLKKMVWEIRNAPKVKRERFGPAWNNLLPYVLVRSDDFNMDRNTGSLRSWEDFGMWMHDLWDGRNEISDETRQEVAFITEGYEDPHDIIRVIYRYIQNHTRYVSIQLGIGGFQTETAEQTQRNRYGDCKALTNLMHGMLTAAGIESYPALIRSGSRGVVTSPDFVFNSFNHTVVFIPLEQDTVWVETTSSNFPPGYIGSGNANRYALIFNENGGTLVKTPDYKPRDNFQLREATVHLQADGSATAGIQTRYGGARHERIRNFTRLASGPLNRALYDDISLSRFEMNNHEVGAALLEPEAWINLDLDISSYARSMGNRLFFNPNMLASNRGQVAETQERTQAIHQNNSYYDVDEFTYHIPEGYRIETLPGNVILDESFGYFETEYIVDEDSGTLTFRRTLKLIPEILPPEEFGTFRNFVNSIPRHDSAQVVLVKG